MMLPTLLTAASVLLHAPDPKARAILDTAIARMGGIAALRSVDRVKVESVTEWQRTSFEPRATTPVIGDEWNTELRDYRRPGWRYTRRFFGPTGMMELVDLVTDSVAAIKFNGRWRPQNVAYVEERDELFTFSPERLLLLADEATDATVLADTTIATVPHTRVRASIRGIPTTLHFDRGSGALSLVTFRRAQLNDFGLAPWGEMDVAIHYSRWQRPSPASPLALPMQFDVFRVGRPYKRVTVQSMQVNPPIPADSLDIPDSLRAAFAALGGRAMWDLPVDSARIIDERFAVFNTPGTASGAIKIGGKWLVIEGGAVPTSAERGVAFLAKTDPGIPVAGALITQPSGSGGIAWFLDQRLPVWVTSGARPYADASMRGWKRPLKFTEAASGSWLRVGSDSVRVEAINLPDQPAVAVIYAPSLRWAYAFTPTASEVVMQLAARRGWAVERIGSARAFVGAAPK